MKNYEELFCDIINICLQQFENKDYLTPEEKHMLVKVMGFCLFLIDSEQGVVHQIFQQSRILMPCPFTVPKMFWFWSKLFAPGQNSNILCHSVKLVFVPAQKF